MKGASEIQDVLVSWIAEAARLSPADVGIDDPFDLFGLDSPGVATLTERLARWLGRPVPFLALYEYPTVRRLAAHLAGEDVPADPTPAAAGAGADAVAIVGMACRFPGAPNLEAYWRLLCDGVDAITDRSSAERASAQVSGPGGYLPDIAAFDREYFGIAPAEAREMDPQQRILLEVAGEALEDAGVRRDGLAGSDTGVFIGIAHSEYGLAELATGDGVTAFTPTGNALSIAANRISYCLDLRGPSMSVDTACSSSLVALHLAARSLAAGESTLALVGGVNLILSPAVSRAFAEAGVRSAGGRCRPFDHRADGYVRSEGCGVVVLKPLAAALADRDQVYAVLRGSAVRSDGRTNGLLAPSRHAQESLLRAACAAARVDPAGIGYVEAHGTGTQVGDATEAHALGAVLGSAPGRGAPCVVGSGKSNIGHTEAAAGVAGLIKVALTLRHGLIPPTVHFERAHPEVDLAALGLRVTAKPVPERPRLAAVSSFGFGGAIAHAVLERADTPPVGHRVGGAGRRPRVVPLSARTAGHLDRYGVEFADAGRTAPVEDLLYTSQQRRDHLTTRRAVLVDRLADLATAGPPSMAEAGGSAAGQGIVLVFPGQSGSWRRRAPFLCGALPGLTASLAASDEVLRHLTGFAALPWLSRDDDGTGVDVLTEARRQAAFTAWQIGLVDAWRQVGVRPAAVVGHSLGEVAAAYAAGGLSREQALRVAVARGDAIAADAGAGSMAMVELPAHECERRFAASGRLWLAAENGPTTSVLAGDADVVAATVATLAAEGVFARVVEGVGFASHGPAVHLASDRLRERLAGLRGDDTTVPLFSTVTGQAMSGSQLDADYWSRNLRMPVRFHEALLAAARAGYRTYLEISSQTGLAASVSACLADSGVAGHRRVLSLGARDTEPGEGLDRVLAALYEHGVDVDWAGFDDGAGRCVGLPPRPWKQDRYWKDTSRAQRPVSGANPGGAHGWRAVELARFPDLLVRERDVRAQEYAISQHVVGGRMLVPAAAWLHMAYEVLAVTDGQWLGMTDLDFTRARWSDRDERLAVQLTKVALQPDDERFTLHARDGEGAWQEHVTGRLSPSLHQPVAGTRWTVPAAIVDRCPVRLDGGTLYQALAAASVGYGPGLRLVEEVWTGQGEAIGRLSGWDVGAAPLDAAMHVIAAVDGALPAAGDRPYVPYRLGRLRVRAATTTGTVWSHATVRRAEPETPDELSADVRVLDEAGNILAEFGELRLRQLRTEAATAAPAVDGTYHVRWRPVAAASPTVPARSLQGAVWISHRAAGPGPALLREAGVDVREVPARVDAVVAAAGSVTGKSDRTAIICDLSAADAPNPDQPMAAVLESVRQVLDVIRELPLRRGLSELVVLTGDAVSVRPSDPLARPDLAAVWGLLRCAAFELPDLRIARVDLETGPVTRDLATFCRALADGELRPELGLRDGHWYAPRLARTTVSRGRVRLDGGAYLITGGLGGLGLAVANRLAQRGAQRLVLVGRRGPTAEGRQQIERMRAEGCDVVVEQADVTLPADVARACGQARRNGAVLRGVVHAAGVLRDRALLGMNPDDLRAVLAPKVEGAWHLHQATLADPLDFFLLFSSAAAVLGSPGQGNYAAANAFLDAFAHRRRAGGRAATSVNWGPWAEIGMVAEPAANPDRSAQLVRALMPADGLDAVEAIIRSGVTDVTVLPYDVGSLVHLSPATADPEFFGEVVGSDLDVLRPGMSTAGSNRPDLARRFVPPDGPVERRIAEIWQRGLGIEGIGAEDSLYELGGDSVFAGQVLTRINQEYGIRINFAAAFATFTIRHLAEMVDAALIANVAAISDDEARRLLAESGQSPSEGVA